MPVTVSPLTPATAAEALRDACDVVRLDPTDAELVRLGTNAVFRLRDAATVVRIARSTARLRCAVREVSVARWLAGSDFPAVRALDLDQPIVVSNRVATFWRSVAEAKAEYGVPAELAKLLRELHGLRAPAHVSLPPLRPFDRAFDRLRRLSAIDHDDRAFLLDRCQQLANAYAGLSFVLSAGPVHGDASVGNVIRDDEGRAVLADLDGFAIGPREWDLVLTALYYEQFGWHTEDEYRSFVEGYGYDVMTWPGYPILRDLRELLMVTWLAQNAESDGQVMPELAKRVATLRTGASRRDWKPF